MNEGDPKLDLSRFRPGTRDYDTYERWYNKTHVPPTPERMQEECWIWAGSKRGGRKKGMYAQFWYDGKNGYGHRYSYEVHHGPIPEGMEVDHTCRRHDCVNPWHLRLLPRRSNRRRTSQRREIKWGGGDGNGTK